MTSKPLTLYIQAMMKKLRYALEGALIIFAMVFFRLMPLDWASGLSGFIGRHVGSFSRAHKTARTNLESAMPELSEEQKRRILGDMWENLGRVIGEYPHLNRSVMKRRITVEGREYLEQVRASGKGAIFISGHFANWEIIPLIAGMCGLPLVIVYREANNPVAEWLIRKIRAPYIRSMHGKGRVGAIQSIKELKKGNPLALLVDQKQNDGSPVPFFGRDAMTVTAPVQLAAKFNVPVLIARGIRTDGAHFHVSLEPPKYYDASVNPSEAMTGINALLERWIREHPAQWFWVHRRWG